MSKTHESCRKLSSVSIRKCPVQNLLSDTHEREKEQPPTVDVEALRTIGRLVRTIKERIEAGPRRENGSNLEFDRDSGSSAPRSADRGEDRGRKEEELEELCRLASDVPGLWHHPSVSHQERKEILRCLIDHIVVAATKEKIDASIVWTSGQKTSLTIWRGIGRYNLVRELHAQGLTVFEIQERLAAGITSTGQRVAITIGRLYVIHRQLGLTPNRFSAEYVALRERALALSHEGRSIESIAEQFNEQGYRSAPGKSWTWDMVYGLLRAQGKTPISLEQLHREAITEARARGLTHRRMAEEFNERGIRRRDGQGWTARSVKNRWGVLSRPKDRGRGGPAGSNDDGRL